MTTQELIDTTDTLLTRYHVDMAHARYVADLALTLFDGSECLHSLSQNARRLLEIGAWLHNVGMTTNPDQHHIVGRDIVLGTEIEELDEDERSVVACMIAFHRKKVRPSLEPAYLSLGKKDQSIALRLSALLRVADGLDYSQSQTTKITACELAGATLHLRLAGPNAVGDGARAAAKADLWSKAIGGDVAIEVEGEQPAATGYYGEAEAAQLVTATEPAVEAGPELASPPTIASPPASEETLAEMGRRQLRRYFRRLLSEERDVQADKGAEAVHQMRVASRRLRATLMVLREVAPPQAVQRFSKEVQRIAQAAGLVRDCDVFLAQVAGYAERLPEERRDEVLPLTEALLSDRAKGRERLLERLDSERYIQFKRNFAMFMISNVEGWNTTLRVRDLAGSILWRRYEALRSHETTIQFDNATAEHAVAIHEARIDGKRLRYMLDVFAEAMGERADAVIEPLVALQDYLGALQDIAVAVDYVAALKVSDEARPGLEAYTASREEERSQLLAGLPQRWEKVMSASYRRKLMEAVIKL